MAWYALISQGEITILHGINIRTTNGNCVQLAKVWHVFRYLEYRFG